MSTVPVTVCISDFYPRDCIELHTPSNLFRRSRRYLSVEECGAPHALGRLASSVIVVYLCVHVEMTGDCVCPCGVNTVKVTTSYLSAQYTDQAMGCTTGKSGLDSQCSQRFLFAGVSSLALAPTEPPCRLSTGGICPGRNMAWCEADNQLVPVLSICGAVPPPTLVVMTGHLRHCLTLSTQMWKWSSPTRR